MLIVTDAKGRELTLVVEQFLEQQVVDQAPVLTARRVGLHARLEDRQLPATANGRVITSIIIIIIIIIRIPGVTGWLSGCLGVGLEIQRSRV